MLSVKKAKEFVQKFVHIQDHKWLMVHNLLEMLPSDVSDSLASDLGICLESEGFTFRLIEALVSNEVEETSNVTTLFRGSSAVNKVCGVYTQSMICKEYLRNVLGGLINDILDDKYGDLEIKGEKGSKSVDTETLTKLASSFLESICNSLSDVPDSLKAIAYLLNVSCQKKFPGNEAKIVGGFIFLRFICPAIMFADKLDIIGHEPSLDVRRILVLITKTLQNTSNKANFSEKSLKPMNHFIEKNHHHLVSFYNNISMLPQALSIDHLRGANFLDSEIVRAVENVVKVLFDKWDKLLESLEKNPKISEKKMTKTKKFHDVVVEYHQEIMHPKKDKKSMFSIISPRRRGSSTPPVREIDYTIHQVTEMGLYSKVEEEIAKYGSKIINIGNKEGMTPLHLCCAGNFPEILKLLLKNSADCYIPDKKGWTCLHCACYYGAFDCLLILVQQKHMDWTAVNDDNNTALHYLARGSVGNIMIQSILTTFVKRGADINCQNINGETPLHLAVWKQNSIMCQSLLEQKADFHIPNYKNESSLHWAQKCGNKELADLFEKFVKIRQVMG